MSVQYSAVCCAPEQQHVQLVSRERGGRWDITANRQVVALSHMLLSEAEFETMQFFANADLSTKPRNPLLLLPFQMELACQSRSVCLTSFMVLIEAI